MVGHLKSI